MTADLHVAPDPTEWKQREVAARDKDAEDYFDYCRRSLGPYGDQGQVRLVLGAARLRPEHRVLDAGCGVGRFTIPAAKRTKYILAVDFSAKSIEVLDRELKRDNVTNVDSQVGDLTTIELPQNSFDRAIAPGVIHHIPAAELRVEAMRRILGALKPGGRVAILIYRWGGNIRPPMPKEGMHQSQIYYFASTVEEARKLLEQAGYANVRVRGFLSLPRRVTLRLPGWMSCMEPVFAWFPWSVLRAHSLLVTGTKPA